MSLNIGKPCPQFTTTLDELKDKFSSTIFSVAVNGLMGVSASFLEKIWHISPEQPAYAVDRNSQHNRQSADGVLSRHFSTNDRML